MPIFGSKSSGFMIASSATLTLKRMYEKSGYGKRPLWHWILLYVVIAAVVYGIAYYFFFAGNGYGNTSAESAAPTILQSLGY